MTRLPVISAKEFIKILKKLGYEPDHQTGSHVILRQEEEPHRRLSVPNHKELKKGTLRKPITAAGLSLEEFNDLR
jgi:predicted RNA binding protein YcfA (HicA-like mRNA interferase family)